MINFNTVKSTAFLGVNKKNQEPTTQVLSFITPKLKVLNQDTVSFSGRKYVPDAVMTEVKQAEKESSKFFFGKLRELCEHSENDNICGQTEAYAHGLKDEDKKRALDLLDLIENHPNTDQSMKINCKFLRPEVGKESN